MIDVALADLFDSIVRSGLLPAERLEAYRANSADGSPAPKVEAVLRRMVQDRLLTPFQAKQLLHGKHKGFFFGDKYKVLAHLGSGGMGHVYLCEQLLLHRLVAVKVLQTTGAPDSNGASERFFREARAVAQLDHPNIVRVFDMERTDTGPYMVMEYVEGTNLQTLVSGRGPVAPERAMNFVLQAARGLAHAHGTGLIHRDIKPGNLLLDRLGTVKLLDLGLARFQTDLSKNANITAKYDDKIVLGTADFMAPEQTIDSSSIDIRADIYSLGCTLYYLLTGRAPFEGLGIAQKLLWHQLRPPDPVTDFRKDIPEPIIAVLNRMMAKKPENRFQTPAELIAELATWEGLTFPPKSEEMPRIKSSAYRLGLTPPGNVPSGTRLPILPHDEPRKRPDAGADLPTPQLTAEATMPLRRGTEPQAIPGPQPLPVTGSIEISMSPSVGRTIGSKRKLLGLAGALVVAVLAAVAIWFATRPSTTASVATTEPAPIPVPAAGSLDGGGSTFVEKMIAQWGGEYSKTSGVSLRYEGVGSGKGIQGMIARKYAFGCTDAAMTDDELAAAARSGAEIAHIPLVMGAVVPTYNLPDLKAPIRFTGPVLADIYLGKITNWNHPAIRISNPDLVLPDRPITVVYRNDKSGTTFIWTDYLGKVSAAWREAMGATKTEYAEWPVGVGAGKNDGVVERVTQTIGAIGYVELAFAREKNLAVGMVRNAARKDIDPSLESVTAAAASLKGVPFDLRYTLTDAPGEKSYPIAGSSWAVFDLKHPDPATRLAVVEFLWWATHDGQKQVPKLLYAPLPAELVGLIEAKLRPLRPSP